MSMHANRLFAAAFVAVVLAVSTAPAASAEEGAADGVETSWGVQPSSEQGPDGRGAFVYELEPGESVTDYVGVSNLGAEPISVRVYAMDAVTTSDGAFTLPPAGTASKDVGAWVGVGGDEVFEIAPSTRLDIPFRLTVPPDASPGDHAGGVVAALSELSASGDGAQQVAVDRRVGARIYVTVPGEQLPALAVGDVEVAYDGGWNLFDGTATVAYTLTNTGNMRVGGDVRLALDGPFGWRLGAAEPRSNPEILPGASVRVEEELTGIVPALLLTAAAELQPSFAGGAAAIGGEHRASGTGWAIPYPIAIAVLVLLALLAVVVVRRVRRRRAAKRARAAAAGGSDAAPAGPDADGPDDDPDDPAGGGVAPADRDLVDAR